MFYLIYNKSVELSTRYNIEVEKIMDHKCLVFGKKFTLEKDPQRHNSSIHGANRFIQRTYWKNIRYKR